MKKWLSAGHCQYQLLISMHTFLHDLTTHTDTLEKETQKGEAIVSSFSAGELHQL